MKPQVQYERNQHFESFKMVYNIKFCHIPFKKRMHVEHAYALYTNFDINLMMSPTDQNIKIAQLPACWQLCYPSSVPRRINHAVLPALLRHLSPHQLV